MKIKEVICALERFAPLPLQESYDNAGLQVGLTEVEASGALLCLDVTEEVLDEAVSLGCNLVVSHHPLLFHGLKRVTDRTLVERCLSKAIKNDITIYSAHTNLDNAEDGVNYKIADKLGLEDVRLLQPHPVSIESPEGDYTVMAGSGIVGTLPVSEDAIDFLQRIKEIFHIECLMHNELMQKPIKRVVICGHGSLSERTVYKRNFIFNYSGCVSRYASLHYGSRYKSHKILVESNYGKRNKKRSNGVDDRRKIEEFV